MIWIFVGMLLISLSLSYAWWVKVRIICLKQDVFDIRDELFDTALELNALDDLAYQQARNHLNNVASTAGILSVPFILVALSQDRVPQSREKSLNQDMQNAIDAAITRCAHRIWNYLQFETIMGWFGLTVFSASKLTKLIEHKATQSIESWLYTSSPEEISEARKSYRDMKHSGMHPA